MLQSTVLGDTLVPPNPGDCSVYAPIRFTIPDSRGRCQYAVDTARGTRSDSTRPYRYVPGASGCAGSNYGLAPYLWSDGWCYSAPEDATILKYIQASAAIDKANAPHSDMEGMSERDIVIQFVEHGGEGLSTNQLWYMAAWFNSHPMVNQKPGMSVDEYVAELNQYFDAQEAAAATGAYQPIGNDSGHVWDPVNNVTVSTSTGVQAGDLVPNTSATQPTVQTADGAGAGGGGSVVVRSASTTTPLIVPDAEPAVVPSIGAGMPWWAWAVGAGVLGVAGFGLYTALR